MAAARVLDVGNCGPDHALIRNMIESNFDATVERVMYVNEAEAAIRERAFDLVLVNRLIFEDQSEGLTLVRNLKAGEYAAVPVMLVSNLASAQAEARAAGAEPGFGKARIGKPETLSLLARYLPARDWPGARDPREPTKGGDAIA